MQPSRRWIPSGALPDPGSSHGTLSRPWIRTRPTAGEAEEAEKMRTTLT